jgi:outer membrane receptor protein involved in Fe transport
LPGALADPLRAIEALPGVTPTLSGVPYFFVRGAPPGDVGYFFDGIRLPALFHALGGPSVVHPAMVETVELYPGPYPVQYGKVAAAAVVARAAEPALEPRAELALRATDSSAFADSPLGDATNLTLSGRYSYANPILHLFAADMDVEYWDYQARLVHRASERDRLTLLAFGAHDALTDVEDGKRRTLYGVNFHRAALRYEHALSQGSVSLQLLGGADRSLARGGEVQVDDLSGELRMDVEQGLSQKVRLRTGASISRDQYRLDVQQLDDPQAQQRYREQFPSRADAAGSVYLALDLEPSPGISVTPGVRADAYLSGEERALAVDPRVSAEYRVSPRLALRTALGVAHQPPASSVPSPGLNPTLGRGLQTGVQHSYGFHLRLASDIALEVTLFQTALFDLSDSIGQSRAADADERVTEDTRGLGRSRGVELLLKRSLTRKLGGFVSYTLSSSQRSVNRVHVPSSFDRRHVLGAALGYDWGAGFRSGVRGTLYSGIPADVAYLEAAAAPPRTSPYYRLDLRSEKRWRWGRQGYFSLVLEVLNATLNREVLSASCSAYGCKERRVGPVTIPNLGIEAAF